MYRPQIKVLDCTIRDGGLINNHKFDIEFVRKVYKAISESGVDIMEIGYKNSKGLFSENEVGPWKFCDDDVLKEVIDGIDSKVKLSAMVDIGRVELDDVKPATDSPLDIIRTACYVKDIDKAIYMANHFKEKGYETAINVMAVSVANDYDLDEGLKQIESESNVDVVNIVDSFGSLYQEPIERFVKKYKTILKTKEIGIHAHNNQQLAFSNTIESIIHGANYLDATLYGIGRGAGNCPLELLVGFLKNPKYDIRPILDIIAKEFIPLREQIEWGYLVPYAITGMFNEHPRSAIALRASEDKEEYKDFYDKMLGQEVE